MRDEERYPTAIQMNPFHDAPELVTDAHADPHGRGLQVVGPGEYPKDAESAKHYVLPGQSPPAGHYAPPGQPPSTGHYAYPGQSPPAGSPPMAPPPAAAAGRSRKFCGLRRRTFFIILAIAVIVIIAAVVGGVVGSMNSGGSSESGDDDENNNDSTSPTTTTSQAAPIETGPIEPMQRKMAAAFSMHNDVADVQLFYQDIESTDIFYRHVRDDEPTAQRTVDLDITPNWGSPIAASAVTGSNPLDVNLFYVALQDGLIHIATAELECDVEGDRCSTTSNSIVTEGLGHRLNPDTKLAAMRLDDNRVRIFYQADSNDIWSLRNDDIGNDGWQPDHIAPGGFPGTGIVAYGPNDTSIHVYWVSDAENLEDSLRHMEYADAPGAGDDEAVMSGTGSGFARNVTLTGMWDSTSIRVFYAQPDSGQIVSNYNRFEDNTWRTNVNDNWTEPDGGFVSMWWSGASRLYSFQNTDLYMSEQMSNGWTEPQSLDT